MAEFSDKTLSENTSQSNKAYLYLLLQKRYKTRDSTVQRQKTKAASSMARTFFNNASYADAVPRESPQPSVS